MIAIRLNDEPCKIKEGCTLVDLLKQHGYATSGYAVMLNQHFVPSLYHTTTLLREDDVIEIITPMQGG